MACFSSQMLKYIKKKSIRDELEQKWSIEEEFGKQKFQCRDIGRTA